MNPSPNSLKILGFGVGLRKYLISSLTSIWVPISVKILWVTKIFMVTQQQLN